MPLLPTFRALEISLRALGSHPLRTALSTLGIVMGVASLVAVLAVSDGVERFSRAQLAANTDVQAIAVRPRTTRVVDGVTFPNPGFPVFTAADGESLAAAIPEASLVAVTATGPAMVRRAAGDSARAAVVTGRSAVNDAALAAGRSLTEEDLAGSAMVAVASHRLAEALGGIAIVVGSELLVQDARLTIVGVNARREGETGFRLEVPLGVVQLVTDPGSTAAGIPVILLQARRVEDVGVVRSGVERWLEARMADHAGMVTIENNQTRLDQVTQAMTIFKLLMAAIVSISLLVGGIGIMNVLLASVAERTHEIGIRRAAGARRRDVLRQFLTESVLITGLGSALGLLAGSAGALAVTAIMRARTQSAVTAVFAWPTAAVAAGAAVLVGLVFGIYPALRASRLSPIDAIRHE